MNDETAAGPAPFDPNSPDAPGIPAFLRERVLASYGAGTAARVLDGYAAACGRPVTLRANRLKATAVEIADALSDAGIGFARVPWYEDAFVLADGVRERDVWELDAYRDGLLYLQSLSSMLPPLLLGPRAGADVLDMCAAPGGKTSELAALEPRARVTACEMNAPRADRLAHNLGKLGAMNVQLMRIDARRLDPFFAFDQILLDAPCTGSGTFRTGDDRAAGRITDRLLAKVTRSQAALLDRALSALKPGGELVYSTCSILPEENGEQLRAALRSKRHRGCEIVPLKLDGAWLDGPYGLPLLPEDEPGTLTVAPTRAFEGFFVAKIRRVR